MSIVGMRKFMQGRNLQYIMLFIAVTLAASIVMMMAGGSTGRRTGGSETGGVLARVNGEEIDWGDFENRFMSRVDEAENQSGTLLSAFQKAQFRGQMFDSEVDRILWLQAAKREKVRVSRGEVKKKINSMLEQQLDMMKDQYLMGYKGKKTDKALERELKKQGLSIAKVKADLLKRPEFDPDSIRQQLTIEKLHEKLKNGIDVSDKAVRASFDEVRLRQITIGPSRRTDVQAREQAKQLVEKLRAGADFATLAKQYSEDMYRETGGDRGYFIRVAYLERELASVVKKLKPGEISDPIRMPQGYTIVKVEQRRNALPADYADPKKRKEYRDSYVAIEQQRILSQYYEDLHKTAKITIYDPELRGYKLMKEMVSASSDPNQRKSKALAAIKEFNKAVEASTATAEASARAYAQMAYLYDWMRRPEFGPSTQQERLKYREEAKKAFLKALEFSESNDLRLMVAEIFVEEGDNKKALEHIGYVMENIPEDDAATHSQLMSLFTKMKDVPLAQTLLKKEQEWLKAYQERMQAQQQMTAPGQIRVEPVREKSGGE